jgi:hypothetical protein
MVRCLRVDRSASASESLKIVLVVVESGTVQVESRSLVRMLDVAGDRMVDDGVDGGVEGFLCVGRMRLGVSMGRMGDCIAVRSRT